MLWSGAAKDKVAALEKAGVIVTDSPAKIGEVMLQVESPLMLPSDAALTPLFAGHEGRSIGVSDWGRARF